MTETQLDKAMPGVSGAGDGTKTPGSRSRPYRLGRILIFGAVFLLITLGLAWFCRDSLAKEAIRYALARAGFEVTDLEVGRIDHRAVHLTALRATLKADASQYFEIQSIKLTYGLTVDRNLSVRTIDIAGIDGRFALDGLMSLADAGDGRQNTASRPAMPEFFEITSVIASIEASRFSLITPYGVIDARFDGYFAPREGGEFNLDANGQDLSGQDGKATIEKFYLSARFPDGDAAALTASMAGTAEGRLGTAGRFEWLATLKGPSYTDFLQNGTAALKGHVNLLLKGFELAELQRISDLNTGGDYAPVIDALAAGVDVSGRFAVSFSQHAAGEKAENDRETAGNSVNTDNSVNTAGSMNAADGVKVGSNRGGRQAGYQGEGRQTEFRLGAPGDTLEVRFGESGFITLEPLDGALVDTGRASWPVRAHMNSGGVAGNVAVPQAMADIRIQDTGGTRQIEGAIEARDISFAGVRITEPARLQLDATLSDGSIDGRFDIASPFSYRRGVLSTAGALTLAGVLSGSPAAMEATMAVAAEDKCVDIDHISYSGGIAANSDGGKVCEADAPLRITYVNDGSENEGGLKIEGTYETHNLDFTLSSDDYGGRALVPSARVTVAVDNGAGRLLYDVSDIDVSIDDLVNVSDISVTGGVTLGGEIPRITAHISDVVLSDPRKPRFFTPIRLIPDIAINEKTVSVSGQFLTLDDIELGQGEITLTRDDLSGGGAFDLADLAFYEQGVQPQRLILPLRSVASDIVGAANGRVEFGIENGALAQSSAVFNLVDLAFSGPTGPVAGVSTSLRLANLLPPQTDGAQVMTIGVMTFGANFLDGVVEYTLLPSGDIEIAKAEWPFAGGILGLYGTRVPKAFKTLESMVEIRGLDIGDLFNIVDVTGFDGTGKLNGSLPLKVDEQRGAVISGRLETEGPGRLEYIRPRSAGAGDIRASASAQVPGGAELLFQALENFEYDKLTLDLDGPLQGEMEIKVKALGRNPNVLNGKAIELNVTTKAILSDLIASAQYQTYLTRAAKIPGSDILLD